MFSDTDEFTSYWSRQGSFDRWFWRYLELVWKSDWFLQVWTRRQPVKWQVESCVTGNLLVKPGCQRWICQAWGPAPDITIKSRKTERKKDRPEAYASTHEHNNTFLKPIARARSNPHFICISTNATLYQLPRVLLCTLGFRLADCPRLIAGALAFEGPAPARDSLSGTL
jgi:hypothetical protein